MRHGQASQLASTDADRALTETGRRDVVRVVEARSQALGTVQAILASPYRRARETAALAIKTLDFNGQLLVCNELRPDGNIAALVDFLEKLDVSSVLLVTHQPLIGELASTLTGDPRLRAIDTAWLLGLQTEALAPGFARLLWVQTPPV
tara:strand:- start:5 stop:451 length:447 start_codon:yes stop_codon:yes gene_type:complete